MWTGQVPKGQLNRATAISEYGAKGYIFPAHTFKDKNTKSPGVNIERQGCLSKSIFESISLDVK